MLHNTKILALLTLGVCAIMFYAGLKPKGFRLRNEVSRLGDTNGIRFGKLGIAYTEARSRPQALNPESLSIELVIRVPRQSRDHLGVILDIRDKRSPLRFDINQWDSTLIVTKYRAGFFKDTRIHLGESVKPEETHVVVITASRHNGTALYVDGIQAAYSRNFELRDTGMALGQLVLGNSATADNPWNGTVYDLAMYARVLSGIEVHSRYQTWSAHKTLKPAPGAIAAYAFDERSGEIAFDRAEKFGGLRLPRIFQIPRKEILILPWRNFKFDKTFVIDFIMNLFGFMPFGFFLYALVQSLTGSFKRHSLALTILGGLGYSLFIELAQVFMPTRCSQLSDVILNTLGALAGAWLARKVTGKGSAENIERG
jgi:hypothetical protein